MYYFSAVKGKKSTVLYKKSQNYLFHEALNSNVFGFHSKETHQPESSKKNVQHLFLNELAVLISVMHGSASH